jgi:hypothetical protein
MIYHLGCRTVKLLYNKDIKTRLGLHFILGIHGVSEYFVMGEMKDE